MRSGRGTDHSGQAADTSTPLTGAPQSWLTRPVETAVLEVQARASGLKAPRRAAICTANGRGSAMSARPLALSMLPVRTSPNLSAVIQPEASEACTARWSTGRRASEGSRPRLPWVARGEQVAYGSIVAAEEEEIAAAMLAASQTGQV